MAHCWRFEGYLVFWPLVDGGDRLVWRLKTIVASPGRSAGLDWFSDGIRMQYSKKLFGQGPAQVILLLLHCYLLTGGSRDKRCCGGSSGFALEDLFVISVRAWQLQISLPNLAVVTNLVSNSS